MSAPGARSRGRGPRAAPVADLRDEPDPLEVAQQPVIGIAHPKWDERPLLVVVKKPGAELTKEELIAFYEGKIAKWWTPDDVVFVDAIPLGATGKMQKNKLREQFKAHPLPASSRG